MTDLFGTPEIRDTGLTRADIQVRSGQPHSLIGCDLDEADLSGLDLTGWRFERCSLRHTNFGSARLEETHLLSCRGGFASFRAANLDDVLLRGSDFNNATFSDCRMQGARITGCKFTGASLVGLKALEITFEETLFVNAKLAGHSFRNATLRRLDLAQADLRNCDFRSALLDECSLREAIIEGARFEGADLRGADLGGLKLGDAARFRGAIISRAQAALLLSDIGLKVL